MLSCVIIFCVFLQAFQERKWRSILSPIRRPALSSGSVRNPSLSTRTTSVPVTSWRREAPVSAAERAVYDIVIDHSITAEIISPSLSLLHTCSQHIQQGLVLHSRQVVRTHSTNHNQQPAIGILIPCFPFPLFSKSVVQE